MTGSITACYSRRHGALNTVLRAALVLSVIALAALAVLPGVAGAAATTRVLSYHGYKLSVPAGWPVFRLADARTACVRFNRHAVYLGRPSADQRCPSSAIGHTEAILVEPLAASAQSARAGVQTPQPLAQPSTPGARGSSARIVDAARGVAVIATWAHHPAVIRQALRVRSLAAVAAGTPRPRPRTAVARAFARARPATARAAVAGTGAGVVYTGLGFDACSTPSTSQMSAWGASPYRALGVYIGGTNMACSQPNLTSTWVGEQSAAGWHLIPIYVGLQAPSNSCGCGAMSSSSTTAASQGTAAAQDAVVQAQAVGLGPGNPIYNDMEGYDRTTTNTAAVLAFLGAWTAQLHASGYVSGVYSSAASGMRDLAAENGSGYTEPDDIWIANWNDSQSTADPNVPSADWANHQRLHQYVGDHNETYGGVTINIDGDYLDGATASAAGIAPFVAAAPSLSVSPAADGSVHLTPSWAGATQVAAWQIIAGANPSAMSPVVKPVSVGAPKPIVVRSSYPYFAVQALGADGQVLGSSSAVATPVHVAIFGQSAFVLSRGKGGLPVGCFNIGPCHVTTTITAGRRTLATTGPETIPVGGGLTYFKLTRAGYTTLAHALHNRLGVTISLRDASGKSAKRKLNLVRFNTHGSSPSHSLHAAGGLKFVGATEFVSNGWSGGVLAGCTSGIPCVASLTVTAGRQTIARTGPETLGVNQLGYLHFTLTPAGHRMLMRRRGNQLGVRLRLAPPGTTTGGGGGGATLGATTSSTPDSPATAQVTLAAFH